VRAIAFITGACLAGCSLIVDTSIDNLKCAPDQKCSPGYSCRYDQCVKERSVAEGETCSQTVQCVTGLVCPPGAFTCAKRCEKIYDVASDCGSDRVCAPVFDPDNAGKFIGGACIPTECSSGDAAAANTKCANEGGRFQSPNPANKCIKLAANGGLCLLSCEIGTRTFADPGLGKDACTTDSKGNPSHCGIIASGDKICLPAGNATPSDPSCTLFPITGTSTSDACGLDEVAGNPGLPFVCSSPKGTLSSLDGTIRCRRGACSTIASCQVGGASEVCQQNLSGSGVAVCVNPNEAGQ
jgi:hypothetical protein